MSQKLLNELEEYLISIGCSPVKVTTKNEEGFDLGPKLTGIYPTKMGDAFHLIPNNARSNFNVFTLADLKRTIPSLLELAKVLPQTSKLELSNADGMCENSFEHSYLKFYWKLPYKHEVHYTQRKDEAGHFRVFGSEDELPIYVDLSRDKIFKISQYIAQQGDAFRWARNMEAWEKGLPNLEAPHNSGYRKYALWNEWKGTLEKRLDVAVLYERLICCKGKITHWTEPGYESDKIRSPLLLQFMQWAKTDGKQHMACMPGGFDVDRLLLKETVPMEVELELD